MDTQSTTTIINSSPESADDSNIVDEASAIDESKTHISVLESLVNFSNVVSGTIADLQKVINQHTIDIANLRAEINKLKSAAASSDQQEDGQSASDALANADGMRTSDEYDSLLEKMEMRRAALKTQSSQPQESGVEEQKKTSVEKAREFLKELARQHNSSQLPRVPEHHHE
jgi:hypothetical protein